MTGSVSFTGTIKLRILEAMGLEETKVRSNVITTLGLSSIDPYLQVNVDDENIYQTSKKLSTFSPAWNEDYTTSLKDAKMISFTVFHGSIVGGGAFVSNSAIPLQEIMEEGQPDLWVRIFTLEFTLKFVILKKNFSNKYVSSYWWFI